jgi:DNA-binding MarR family transcriptional regulator
MASASTRQGTPARGVEEDLEELTSLLGGTFRGLKQSAPAPQQLLDAATDESLGPRHMPALIAIATVEPLSVTELARRLGLGLSTTSAIVSELSRAGLVERTEDEADHRRTIVRLQERHREAIGKWVVQARAPLRSALERLSPGARRSFMEGWRILHEEATRGDAGEI